MPTITFIAAALFAADYVGLCLSTYKISLFHLPVDLHLCSKTILIHWKVFVFLKSENYSYKGLRKITAVLTSYALCCSAAINHLKNVPEIHTYKYQGSHCKYNSRRSTNHSRRPNNSIVAISSDKKKCELNFTTGDSIILWEVSETFCVRDPALAEWNDDDDKRQRHK